MTLGEYRVGIDFNPSNQGRVDVLKRTAAAFIDLCEELKAELKFEEARFLAVRAQICIEEAAMWAVKAATKKPREVE